MSVCQKRVDPSPNFSINAERFQFLESDVEVQLVERLGKIQVNNIHILSTLEQRKDFVVVGKELGKTGPA